MHSQIEGAISSAGSEHLPYKQGVTGSNPVSPTKKSGDENLPDFFMPFFSELTFIELLWDTARIWNHAQMLCSRFKDEDPETSSG